MRNKLPVSKLRNEEIFNNDDGLDEYRSNNI